MEKIELNMFGPSPSIEEVIDKVRFHNIVKIERCRAEDENIIAMTLSRYHKLLEKLAEGVIDNEI